MSGTTPTSIELNYTIANGQYTDLPRSNMPSAVDNINEMVDISADLLVAKNQFYDYVQANDLANAAQVLVDNPELEKSVFNADKFNTLRDAIVALERLYLTDIQNYLMNLSTPKGEWNENTLYHKYDVVSYYYQGQTQFYCARVAMTIGERPAVTPLSWTPITARGPKGNPGTGLTPMGTWAHSTQYYNYMDESGLPHVSLVYYKNAIWQAVSNNVDSEPTLVATPDYGFVSNNPNWDVVMVLQQAADTILMPYGKPIADVINEVDKRTKLVFDDLISQGYSYKYRKMADGYYHEELLDVDKRTYATKDSQKMDDFTWRVRTVCNSSNLDYIVIYKKTSDGWTAEKV